MQIYRERIWTERVISDTRAHLDEAYFNQAHLDGAIFGERIWTELGSTRHIWTERFSRGAFGRSDFDRAHLDGARFSTTAHMIDAVFQRGAFGRSGFLQAHLDELIFAERIWTGANFRDAQGLTVGQFAYSKGVDQAHFDEAFRRELEAAKEAANKSAVGNDDTPQDTHPTESDRAIRVHAMPWPGAHPIPLSRIGRARVHACRNLPPYF